MNFSILRNKKQILHKLLVTSVLAFAIAIAAPSLGVKAETSSVKVLTTPQIDSKEISEEDASAYTLEGWIEACQKVGRDLTKYGFTYSNHTKKTFSKALKTNRKCNCATYVSWCLQEYGISKKGEVFYTKRSGSLSKRFKSWKGKVQIIRVNAKPSRAKLQAGDIICWKGIVHTNIYAGRNSNGKMTWIDGGSMGTTRRGRRRYISADRIKIFNYLNKYKVSYVIRIKGL